MIKYRFAELCALGERIKRARRAKGLTQHQLAMKAGTSQPTIHYAEDGTREIKALVLREIANTLGVSTDYLLNG